MPAQRDQQLDPERSREQRTLVGCEVGALAQPEAVRVLDHARQHLRHPPEHIVRERRTRARKRDRTAGGERNDVHGTK